MASEVPAVDNDVVLEINSSNWPVAYVDRPNSKMSTTRSTNDLDLGTYQVLVIYITGSSAYTSQAGLFLHVESKINPLKVLTRICFKFEVHYVEVLFRLRLSSHMYLRMCRYFFQENKSLDSTSRKYVHYKLVKSMVLFVIFFGKYFFFVVWFWIPGRMAIQTLL